MYYYGFWILAVFLWVFCLKFVANTALSLPTDIQTLSELKENQDDRYWPELGVMIFYWIISIAMIVFIIYPVVLIITHGFDNIVKFIEGF